MQTFLATLLVFATAVAVMSLSVWLTGRRLRGSCGGLSGERDEHGEIACSLCSRADECDQLAKSNPLAQSAPADSINHNPGQGEVDR